MTIDLRHSLNEAFLQLDRFSVPGVGTFYKSRSSARLDRREGVILPPSEIYKLSEGEDATDSLIQFVFHRFKISMDAAREAVSDLGKLIREEIREFSAFVILGVGEVRKDEDGGFTLNNSLEKNALAGDDFFGLGELDFTLGAKEITREEKVAAAAESIAASTLVVEPVEKTKVKRSPRSNSETKLVEPVLAPVEQPKKKKGRILKILAVIAILWAVILAGVWFRSELISFTQSIFKQGTTTTLASGEDPENDGESEVVTGPTVDENSESETSEAELDENGAENADSGMESGENEEVENADENNGEVDEGEEVDEGYNEDLTEDNQDGDPLTDSTPAAYSGGVGEVAQAGQHYLVMNSTKDAAYAQQMAAKYDKAPFKTKIIAPPFEGGYYKVSIFNASDKMEVIGKMVDWKTQFEEGTWIYSGE